MFAQKNKKKNGCGVKVVSPENKLYYVDIDTVRFGDSEFVCARFISLSVMQS